MNLPPYISHLSSTIKPASIDIIRNNLTSCNSVHCYPDIQSCSLGTSNCFLGIQNCSTCIQKLLSRHTQSLPGHTHLLPGHTKIAPLAYAIAPRHEISGQTLEHPVE